MNTGTGFKRGDIVVHPRCPEWGEGTVEAASPADVNGKPGQRLIVRFAQHGRVTIHTAAAPLVSRDDRLAMSTTTPTIERHESGWLASLNGKPAEHELWQLPEAMTDPFADLAARLRATLDSFRFSTEARSLIDWAAMQTGLDDPMTRYTRQELETGFARFARDRDLHLRELVKQTRREGRLQWLHDAASKLRQPEARQALAKAIRA